MRHLRLKILWEKNIRSFDVFVNDPSLTLLMQIAKALSSPQSNLISEVPIQFLSGSWNHANERKNEKGNYNFCNYPKICIAFQKLSKWLVSMYTIKYGWQATMWRQLKNKKHSSFNTISNQSSYVGVVHVHYNAKLRQEICSHSFLWISMSSSIITEVNIAQHMPLWLHLHSHLEQEPLKSQLSEFKSSSI